jgi:DNA-binding PadR family transcriptional regulator
MKKIDVSARSSNPDGNKSKENYSLSALEEDILTILSNRRSYGLEISKAIEQASGGNRVIGVGSLYPSLRRLEKKGFARSEWENSENDRVGARRRYYEITKAGGKVLAENREVRNNLLVWQPV